MVAGASGYTAEQLDNLATFKTVISEDNTAAVVYFDGTEPTMAEAQTETSGFGVSYITSENAPTLLGFAKTNACDFSDMLNSYNGGSYEVYLYDAGGNLLGTARELIYGYSTQVWAHANGAIGRDNQTQQYKITLNFLEAEEWRNPSVTPVNYSLNDLLMLMPLGLKATPIIELAGDTGSTEVSIRCVANSELIETLTGEVLGSNVAGATITPTYNAVTEVYDCVVTKTAAAELLFGEYVEGRLVAKTGAIYDKMTNKIKFKGNA
jgi:hypothetical protein